MNRKKNINIDLSKIKTYPLTLRKSMVEISQFAKCGSKNISFVDFYNNLPNLLAAKDFKYLVEAIIYAYQNERSIILMMGAHPIKCGLNNIIVDLINREFITCISLNGAGLIHDFEIALIGKTSEDVAENIKDGSFGMACETLDIINCAIKEGVNRGFRLGESMGSWMDKNKQDFPYKDMSILYNTYIKKTPCLVHVAIGTDIIHQSPHCDGACLGKGSLEDFRKLIENIVNLNDGGVVLNIGSAVIMPEVFIKALNIARNLGKRVENFTTCDFDMYTHYRPTQNIVKRPVSGQGKGISIRGHFEILIPLLHQILIEYLT